MNSYPKRFCLIFSGLLCISAAGGCDRPSPPSSGATAATSSTPASAKTSAETVKSVPVSVKKIDAAELKAAVEKHRGQVVLVDYWATWCPPCVKLFPHSVELHNKLAEKGLTVITLSVNATDDENQVLGFLQKKSATTENYLSSLGRSEKAVEAFIDPNSAVPCFKIYDRQGKLSATLDSTAGEKLEEKINEIVNRLVNER